MSEFENVRNNALRTIAKNQKLKLQLKKYEEIIIKYVQSDQDLHDENEELKYEKEKLQEDFEKYKQIVADYYVKKSPYEIYGVNEKDFV